MPLPLAVARHSRAQKYSNHWLLGFYLILPYIATANFPENKRLHTVNQVYSALGFHEGGTPAAAKLSLRDDLVQATSSVKTPVAWDVVLRLTLVAKKDGGIPGADRDGKNAQPAAKWESKSARCKIGTRVLLPGSRCKVRAKRPRGLSREERELDFGKLRGARRARRLRHKTDSVPPPSPQNSNYSSYSLVNGR